MQALVSIAALVPPPLGYTPPRPAMPPAFKAGFFGAFFNESCFHTGFLFYDDTVRKLRTDWMIGDCADTVGFNLLAKTDINDANAGRILNYYVPFNTTSYACNISWKMATGGSATTLPVLSTWAKHSSRP